MFMLRILRILHIIGIEKLKCCKFPVYFCCCSCCCFRLLFNWSIWGSYSRI